jgi:hypothetical protein
MRLSEIPVELLANLLEYTLITLIVCGTVINILQAFKTAEQLRQKKQTPLMGRDVTLRIAGALGEYAVVFVLFFIYTLCVQGMETVPYQVPQLIALFVLASALRARGSYFAAWATLSVIVKHAQRKEIKRLNKERKETM